MSRQAVASSLSPAASSSSSQMSSPSSSTCSVPLAVQAQSYLDQNVRAYLHPRRYPPQFRSRHSVDPVLSLCSDKPLRERRDVQLPAAHSVANVSRVKGQTLPAIRGRSSKRGEMAIIMTPNRAS
ncbi:hypothetical protein ElyMa_004337200 [Elysia marginata]|uniref:Uncharacterized protein n=1 Tax=Elysia marginata TaxID=1093978 RepID=A0AAV4H2A0_9GAST|nr:hypothetical protein ElyMa_004337200 [Elysia marginata]